MSSLTNLSSHFFPIFSFYFIFGLYFQNETDVQKNILPLQNKTPFNLTGSKVRDSLLTPRHESLRNFTILLFVLPLEYTFGLALSSLFLLNSYCLFRFRVFFYKKNWFSVISKKTPFFELTSILFTTALHYYQTGPWCRRCRQCRRGRE